MAKLYKQTVPQYFFDMKFVSRQISVPSKDWTFIQYRVGIYEDIKGLAPAPLADSEGLSYYYEITKLYRDKDWEWTMEIRPSFVQFAEDPAGSRIVQILIAEYSTSQPEEDWDDEYGVFVRWVATLQESGAAASEERTSVVNLARSYFRFVEIDVDQAQKVGADNKLFMAVLVRQTTPIDLNVVNADMTFRLSRKKRRTV